MEHRIVVTRSDQQRIRALLRTLDVKRGKDREHLLDLMEELDRATIVDSAALPADVVALESTVIVHDIEAGVQNSYTLVLPEHADLATSKISVLAPLGTALLGFRQGDEVRWSMPGGIRHLRIEAVQHTVAANDGPQATRRDAA